MPLEMECERGISAMVKNAGKATLLSAHLISPTSCIIIEPINTSTCVCVRVRVCVCLCVHGVCARSCACTNRMITGADASTGTEPKMGAKNSERKKKKAAVMAVSPVRPPSIIPEVHSTAMMIGLLPVHAEITVPIVCLSVRETQRRARIVGEGARARWQACGQARAGGEARLLGRRT